MFYIEKYLPLPSAFHSPVSYAFLLREAKKSAIVENTHESESITADVCCFYLI